MEKNWESAGQKINFTNEVPVQQNDASEELNRARADVVPEITEYIQTNERFSGRNVEVTFAHKGVSSLVSIIATPESKLVLKVRLGIDIPDVEASFLEAWEAVGVSVPHIIEQGNLSSHPYILMEHIDSPTIQDRFDSPKALIKSGKFVEMGQTLTNMHQSVATGYGRIVDGHSQFEEFDSWIKNDHIINRIKSAEANKLLGDEHGNINEAMERLAAKVKSDGSSTYCHNDFSPDNIFDTNPITVFDPNPALNHGYIDLGNSIVNAISITGIDDAAEQLTEGYFSSGRELDREALRSSVLLNAYLKFSYWHQKGRLKKIERLQNYLSSHV